VNNLEMAKSYERQARERLRHAREALEDGNYPYVVRQCQEAVELLLRASLRAAGVEPPKWHDVGPVLRASAERFPEWFREEIPRLARISRKLRREREPSLYGDEETGSPRTSCTSGRMQRRRSRWRSTRSTWSPSFSQSSRKASGNVPRQVRRAPGTVCETPRRAE